MSNPTVSVVIPCYNGAKFLRETLDSVLSQTYPVLEVLVIDDGSTDDSAAIAESYGSPIRVIRQPNQGESVARNRGIDEAKGDWIAFLDADDLWEPVKIEKQIAFSELHPEVKCIHTAWKRFGDTESVPAFSGISEIMKYTVSDVLTCDTPPNTSTLLVHSTLTHRFPSWTTSGEDLLYLADLARDTKFGFINTILVGYRMHSRQQTRTSKHLIKHLESKITWVHRHDKLSKIDKDKIISDVFDNAVSILGLFYWKRQWKNYHEFRSYLNNVTEFKRFNCNDLRKKIYPSFIYGIVDLYRKAIKSINR